MSFRDDIRAVPEEMRTVARETEESLQETADRRPIVRYMLDLRIVLVAAVTAFLVALILRLVGLGYIFSLLVFLLLLVGLWLVIAGAAAPRPPTGRARVREGAQPGPRTE